MTIPIEEFIAENKIKMTVRPAESNPNMQDMPAGSTHWKCYISLDRRQMLVYFSKGPAHNGAAPSLSEVLDCLAQGASGADVSFEEWCAELGFDSDSRRAEKIYRAVNRQSAALLRVLGADGLETLIYSVERN